MPDVLALQMTTSPQSPGSPAVRPYPECATRLETRGDHPPTPGGIASLVEGLRHSGAEAIWHSAVDGRGLPLFPSRVMPDHHVQASVEPFHELIEQVHAMGVPVLSWLPLNMGAGILKHHPQWQAQWYEMEGSQRDMTWDEHYVCINSPFRALLPQFAAEVVQTLGFDGVWFDGSTFANHHGHPWFLPGCRCDCCREQFLADEGLDLPSRVDYSDRVFKRWMRWRYDRLMQLWQACIHAVSAVNPRAVVAFNNYRRRHSLHFGWTTAIPLRRLRLDCLLSGELDGFAHQADFQMKLHEAYGCRRGIETWWPLCDHWRMWVPDHEPLTAIQAGLGAISAGGATAMGVAVDPPLFAPTIRRVQETLRAHWPPRRGEPLPYIAIWCSQADQDFVGAHDTHPSWDTWHGANELCRHSHFNSAVIFDNDVGEGDLEHWPVILMPTQCVSPQQTEALHRYVESGGVVIATRDAGTRDAWGDPVVNADLDRLLGVVSRGETAGPVTLEIMAPALTAAAGHHVSFSNPGSLCRLADDVQVLAHGVDRGSGGGWDGYGVDAQPRPRHPGLWLRQQGRGVVVTAAVDWFREYLLAPTTQMRRLFAGLTASLRQPPVQAAAPFFVTINTRVLDDHTWLIHLHNCPGTMYAYPNPAKANWTHTVGEVPPIHDLAIHLPNAAIATVSALTPDLVVDHSTHEIRIRRLDLHAALSVSFASAPSSCRTQGAVCDRLFPHTDRSLQEGTGE